MMLTPQQQMIANQPKNTSRYNGWMDGWTRQMDGQLDGTNVKLENVQV